MAMQYGAMTKKVRRFGQRIIVLLNFPYSSLGKKTRRKISKNASESPILPCIDDKTTAVNCR